MTEYFWVSTKLSSINLIARLRSSSSTFSRKCIFALASAIRIILSMWRTVIGRLPVACGKISIVKSPISSYLCFIWLEMMFQKLSYQTFLSQLAVQLGNLVIIDVRYFWMNILPGINNVLLQQVLWDHQIVWIELIFLSFDNFSLTCFAGMVFHVRINNKLCQPSVLHRINFVFDNAQDVETSQNWFWQVDLKSVNWKLLLQIPSH